MKHLDEEELVAHFYGDGDAEAAEHLACCARCAEAFAALSADLLEVEALHPPSRDAAYGERVWASIAPAVSAYAAPRRKWLRLSLGRGLSYAAACALLIVAAFLAGRFFEQKQPHPPLAVNPAPPAKPRVVVVVLSDHLDRSERLLVELKHADVETSAPLRDEARTLLAANRICRNHAGNDPELKATLERLDHLLDELAQQPQGLTPATLIRLQSEMNAEGLLFDVRVLRTQLPEPQTANRSHGGIL
jgi:hypothetical protein